MRARTLAVVVVAAAVGYLAGRGGLPPLLVSAPLTAAAPSAAAPTDGGPGGPSGPSPPPGAASPELPGDLSADERRTVEVFRRASASVVHIANIAVRQDLFSLDVLQVQQGTGSGFIWDTSGHIVT
jgi:S1-C subfamily serine protease